MFLCQKLEEKKKKRKEGSFLSSRCDSFFLRERVLCVALLVSRDTHSLSRHAKRPGLPFVRSGRIEPERARRVGARRRCEEHFFKNRHVKTETIEFQVANSEAFLRENDRELRICPTTETVHTNLRSPEVSASQNAKGVSTYRQASVNSRKTTWCQKTPVSKRRIGIRERGQRPVLSLFSGRRGTLLKESYLSAKHFGKESTKRHINRASLSLSLRSFGSVTLSAIPFESLKRYSMGYALVLHTTVSIRVSRFKKSAYLES